MKAGSASNGFFETNAADNCCSLGRLVFSLNPVELLPGPSPKPEKGRGGNLSTLWRKPDFEPYFWCAALADRDGKWSVRCRLALGKPVSRHKEA